MVSAHTDRLNRVPDNAETALLLIDVINDLEFSSRAEPKLLTQALPMAVSLAAVKRRAKAAGIPKHSAFFQTNLESLLSYLGVSTLGLTGMAGDICVLFNANDAYMRDFKVVIPSDCVASEEANANQQALMLMQRVLKANTSPSR
jgi:nicotinamidase-related amidase